MLARLQGRTWLAAAVLAISGTVSAASLQVAPTGLEFRPTTPAQGLQLTNTGSSVLNAQVRVFHWTQADGKDVLTPTQALVASPPMLNLAPGAKQLVRVIRLGAPNAAVPELGEAAYRVLVDELPATEEGTQTGVRYVLRYSIPVFVASSGSPADGAAIAGALRWSLQPSADGIALQAQNTGLHHAQLSQVSLLPPGSAPHEISAGLLGYVLPGMTMRWPLKLDAAQLPPGTRIKVFVNGKPVDDAFAIGDLPR